MKKGDIIKPEDIISYSLYFPDYQQVKTYNTNVKNAIIHHPFYNNVSVELYDDEFLQYDLTTKEWSYLNFGEIKLIAVSRNGRKVYEERI